MGSPDKRTFIGRIEKPTAYYEKSQKIIGATLCSSLLNRNLFCAFLYLFLFRKEKFKNAIFIFSLDTITIDAIVQVERALKTLERKLLADRLIIFRFRFFLLLKANGQLTGFYGELEIFLAASGSAQFKMIGICGLMDIYRGKTKAFIPSQTGRQSLEEFIYKAGKALVAVVVNFYECHNLLIF